MFIGALMLPGVAGVPALAQCAMCGSAAASSAVGRGLNISILFLFAVLGAAILGLLVLIVRASRQAERTPAGE